MGCADTHQEYDSQELEIQKTEMKLPYIKHPPSFIDFVHRKYSLGENINKNQ
jgi:hypothetical protein